MARIRYTTFASVFAYGVALSSGSSTNVAALGLSNANANRQIMVSGAATQALINLGQPAIGDTITQVLAAATNDVAHSVEGQTQAVDSSATLPVLGASPVIEIGGYAGGTSQLACDVIEVRLTPSRLPNAECEDMGGNS
jgi:hypothetical protein